MSKPTRKRYRAARPAGLTREFLRALGPRAGVAHLDCELARSVAEEVQRRCYDAPRRSRELVDVVLLDIGARSGNGFSERYGYTLLKAGRYLLSKGERQR